MTVQLTPRDIAAADQLDAQRAASTPARRRWSTPWVVAAVVLTLVTALGAAQYGWWRYMTVAIDHATATGTVIATNCRNDNEVTYSFPVNGAQVQGEDIWAICRSSKPGDQLPISYAANDPSQSMAGDAYSRFWSETISILIATTLGSLVVAAVFTRAGKQENSPASE